MPSSRSTPRQAGSLGQQIMRYTVSGGIAAVVTMIVYAAAWRALRAMGVRADYLFADVLAWTCGMLANYVLSSRWVFKQSGPSQAAMRDFSMFAVIGLIGLGLSQIGLWLLVGRCGMHRDLAKVIMIGTVFVWNFSARRAWFLRPGTP